MRRINLRLLVKPALPCALLTLALLILNPWDSIWITTDQLTPRESGEMLWTATAILFLAPIAGGLLTGFAIGRRNIKHYRPMMKGGLATLAGLTVGLAVWGVLGAIVHGLQHGFASLAMGLMFLILAGAAGFVVGGITARKVAWGVVLI